jgi:hypothetical protein
MTGKSNEGPLGPFKIFGFGDLEAIPAVDSFEHDANQVAYGVYAGWKLTRIRCEAPDLDHHLPEWPSVRDAVEVVERIENGGYTDDDLRALGRSLMATFNYSDAVRQKPERRHPDLFDAVWWLQGLIEREVSTRLRQLIIVAFWKCDTGDIPQIAVDQRNAALALAEAQSRLEVPSTEAAPKKRSWWTRMTDLLKCFQRCWKSHSVQTVQIGE